MAAVLSLSLLLQNSYRSHRPQVIDCSFAIRQTLDHEDRQAKGCTVTFNFDNLNRLGQIDVIGESLGAGTCACLDIPEGIEWD